MWKLRATRHYHQSAQHKRYLVREAKNKPCVDCLAEGRRADWPLAGMTLDHTGRKTMEFFTGGNTVSERASTSASAKPSYQSFSVSEIRRELATCEPVCGGHHNIRTRARLLAACPDEDEGEDEEGEGGITLF